MIVTPLDGPLSRSLRDTLLARGWDAERARESAAGMAPVGFHLSQLDAAALEALVVVAGRVGLEVVTGDDWAVLSGPRSRCAIFGRPWGLPPELTDVAIAIAQALHDDDPLDHD